jgi:hypothetical protein
MTSFGRGRPLIPFAAALTVVGIAVLSFSMSGKRQALASPPPLPSRLHKAITRASCSLPVAQQLKAVKTFREMLPVFRHPRCFNCHGGLDITDSIRHEGAEFVPKGMNPRAMLTAEKRKELHEQCDLCHTEVRGSMTRLDGTQLAGWMVAPQPMLWNGKSDERLCLDMKRFEENADSFVSHIKTDHGEVQFIEAAYHGVRALSPKERTSRGIVPEPPPGSQSDLVAKARKWKELLEGQWKEQPECGCVLPQIRLQIHHRSEIDPTHATHRLGWVGFSGEANFEVSLAAVHEAEGRIYFRGEKSLFRPLQTYFADKRCKGTASQQEEWLWTAEVDMASEEMTLQWSSTRSEEKGEGECITGGYRSQVPLDPLLFGGQSLEPLVLPLDRDTVQVTGEEEDGSAREWLKIKVIAAPAK